MTNIENRFNAAIAALDNSDVDTAFTLFCLLAEEKYPLGQHFLGWCYEQGIGVEKNENAAFELWLQSAEAEIPESQHALGSMFENGVGTEKDVVRAYYWYARAAVAGDERSGLCVERLKLSMSSLELNEAEILLK